VEERTFDTGVAFSQLTTGLVPALTASGLPAPFSAIPTTGAGAGGLLGGCSFCVSATAGALGAIRFSPDGAASIATANSPAGGTLAIGTVQGANSPREAKVLAISTPGGVVRLYQ
jgi:hypothetical protein